MEIESDEMDVINRDVYDINEQRKQRNRELLLKIEAMKEMDVRNDVIHNGGLMNEYDEYKE